MATTAANYQSPITSHTPGPTDATTTELTEEAKYEVLPPDLCEPLVFPKIFENGSPVEVDLGSGSGKFLIEAGGRFPNRNFLGIERLLGRVRKTRRKACRLQLANVRVLRLEIDYAVRYLLPPNSVTRFHLSFPDPWPKRRHHNRRLVNEEFLQAIASALTPEGEFWIKTDHAEYFRQIEKNLALVNWMFVQVTWEDEYPPTDFETEFMAQNLPIYRLRLCKVIRPPR
jgi:tRNA (guanine-N7-)-methyltransferase